MEGGEAPHCLWLHCNQDDDNATIVTIMNAMLVAAMERSKLPRAIFVFNLHMGMGKIH
jgi:hypothetical protein